MGGSVTVESAYGEEGEEGIEARWIAGDLPAIGFDGEPAAAHGDGVPDAVPRRDVRCAGAAVPVDAGEGIGGAERGGAAARDRATRAGVFGGEAGGGGGLCDHGRAGVRPDRGVRRVSRARV